MSGNNKRNSFLGNESTSNTIRNSSLAYYIDDLVQDWSNSSVLAMELLQSCAKPSIYYALCGYHIISYCRCTKDTLGVQYNQISRPDIASSPKKFIMFYDRINAKVYIWFQLYRKM